MSRCLVSVLAADGVASFGVRPSANITMTKFESYIYMGPICEVLIWNQQQLDKFAMNKHLFPEPIEKPGKGNMWGAFL